MTLDVNISDVAAVVLAGGLSRRMGTDKALAMLGGRPLMRHVVARLAPQVATLAVNANGDTARFAPFGLPVLPDPIPDFQGPLAGILAAMHWAQDLRKTYVLTVPADAPFIPADLAAQMRTGIGDAEAAVATSHNGEDHPTVALWRASLAGELAAWLKAGTERSVRAWIATRRSARIAFADGTGGDPFFNVNTPEDLARAAERFNRERQ